MMRKAIAVFLLALVIPALAGADLTIKEKTTVRGMMGMWTSDGDETTYLKGEKYRNESKVERSGAIAPMPVKNPPPRVTIIRLDKGIMWRVNLKDKTYQELSLAAMAENDSASARFKIADLKVEPTGETKEIVGRPCKGVRAKVVYEVDRGDTVANETLDMLFWMTEDTKGLEDMKTFWEESLKLAQGEDQKIPVWDILGKMSEGTGEVKGVPLGIDVTLENALGPEKKAEMEQSIRGMLKARAGEGAPEPTIEPDQSMRITREVVSISTDKIADSLFEIPEGFKKAARIRIW
jgi:hypothetical protein